MVHYSYQGITGYNCISISEHQCFYLSKQCRSWWCLFRTLSPGDRKFNTCLCDIWVFFFTSTVFAYLNSTNNWIFYIFKTKVFKCLQQYRSKSDCMLTLIYHFAVSISIKVLFPTLAYINLQRTCNGFVLQMAHFYSKKSIVKKSLQNISKWYPRVSSLMSTIYFLH